jgi:hypothetical protein
MTTRSLAAALLAAFFAVGAASVPARAQSIEDLIQKGIYAQETLGDLDGAIRIYRQATNSQNCTITMMGTSCHKPAAAAQAQYQLVLCMLQKGDRAAAAHELDLLTRDFPDQQDFINRARKLIPGASTLLAPTWADGEASQLNIKRDGVSTGEYLYYSATPWRNTVPDQNRDPARNRPAADNALAIYLGWELVTNSTRSVVIKVDRDTMRRTPLYDLNNQTQASFDSDDVLGDASAAPFAGPAIDTDALVFRMRVLPLAVGYKTTVSILPFLLGHGVSKPVELAVAGVETVQTVAGKFNCYKVVFASLGQTFWIGVDGARPLVKFQSGNVEAELVKVWGPSVFDDALVFLKTAGWSVADVRTDWQGPNGQATASSPEAPFRKEGVSIQMRRIYTPSADIERALQQACDDEVKNWTGSKVRPRSVQTRLVAGHPSLSCIIDNGNNTNLGIWIGTESMILRFNGYSSGQGSELAVWRWMFEPVLDTIKLP